MIDGVLNKQQPSRWRSKTNEKRNIPNHFSVTSPSVKEVYVNVGEVWINFTKDGVKRSLVDKGIIYQASQLGDTLRGWAFNMQPWARENLELNQHLPEGLSDKVNTRFPSLY